VIKGIKQTNVRCAAVPARSAWATCADAWQIAALEIRGIGVEAQESRMIRLPAFLAGALALAAVASPTAAAQTVEKRSFNYSAWTTGIFSEAVTVTNVARAKFVFLAGIGAEDENGPRGNIRHKGDFTAQCQYAFDKIRRALAANGAGFGDAVKMIVYVTDMRYRLDYAKCSSEVYAGATVPAQTLLGISQLAFPEMMVEIDVTAIARE